MIPRTHPPPQPRDASDLLPWPAGEWRQRLGRAISDPERLLELLNLPADLLPAARRAAADFGLLVPREFVARMTPGDAADPLLAQVLPLADELAPPPPGFSADPLAEAAATPIPGLLHKYQGRVLVLLAGGCAVNCRYCFRRHFPYGEHRLDAAQLAGVLRAIAADRSIHEVILSGGDPLLVDDDRLADLARRLAEIPHLRRLRIHTRLPVVLPQRVDAALVGWLGASELRPVVVIHANHPAEIGADLRAALAALAGAGVTLLNQAVLLAGVNDRVDTLARLSEELFAAGVLPYYLHLLDRVTGAAHFDLPEARARALHADLSARLPGYLVPRLVREVPGDLAKRPLPPLVRD